MNIRKKIQLASLFTLFVFSSLGRAFTVSSDQQYYVYDDHLYRFIYSEEYRPFIKALAAHNEQIKSFYEKDFGWKLDEKPYLILASPRNQIANGFATLYPSLFTVFYGGGAETVDEFASASWLNTLLPHETAHLYQLDTKQDYSRFLKKAFGNPTPNFYPPFTYMETPNYFLPTFILEGNATYNEGRFGNGGRLYDGENRALFLSLLKAGKVTSKRLINDHIEWPYGREKYIVGAYIQLFLAQEYGIEKVNAFFLKNAENFVNPLELRRSFVATFGVGYEEVLLQLKAFYSSYVSTMKTTAAEAVLATSINHGGFTREGSKIYFMTSDGHSAPYLYQIAKSSSGIAVEKKRHDMPFGKPLLWNGKVYVASGQQIESSAVRYSLFTDGYSRLEQFDNKFVYDTSGNTALYADVPKSFEKAQLYDNGKFLGTTESSAQYDEDKKPLYFRQAGDQRTLYRDGSALVTYKGYYGRVADTAKNGDVFIIAATERGSGVFKVHGHTLSRVLAADTVVDANLLSDTELVVAEITDEGYRYKVVPLEPETSETPFVFEYPYEKDASMKILARDTPDERNPNAAEGLEERPYSMFRYFRFDGIDPLLAGVNAAGDVIAGVTARFTDPMLFHSLNFGYTHMEGDTNDALLLYQNRYYKLNWTLGASFDQTAILKNAGQKDQKVLSRYQTWGGIFQLNHPLFTHPKSSGEIVSRYKYEYDESNDPDQSLLHRQSVLTYVDLKRSRSYLLSYSANSADRLVLAHRAIGGVPWGVNRNKYAADATVSRDVWNQNYVSAGYHLVTADTSRSRIKIDHQSATGLSLDLYNPTELIRYSQNGPNLWDPLESTCRHASLSIL